MATKRKYEEDCIPETPQQAIQDLKSTIQMLFDEGICYEEQLPSFIINSPEKSKILKALEDKFSPSKPLIELIPDKSKDSLKEVFFDSNENWFHRAFNQSKYSKEYCAKTMLKWLKGELNTLVFVGGPLTIAKNLYNAIASCFPNGITIDDINCLESLHKNNHLASVYCIPFVNTKPSPSMLHLMEGNNISCNINNIIKFMNTKPMLIHCTNPSLVDDFICQNTAIFEVNYQNVELENCKYCRSALRDFVYY
ncbi:hypothetical protein ORF13 [Crane-associated adenovirus 1]|uniref:Parvovirus non-structural protein 1 helicase domain-containing protein n=1 Tax=Crane-associated adenovirus 1 TaxID=2559941 RepID=A0A5H2X3B6_9ADEN|nr:hypothetical protein ORF13 [Crane-associated adenovirus 1]